MDQMRIFVSHSSRDNAFCDELVRALRGEGADVWYDQHNLGAGQLLEELPTELRTHPVFVVILSKDAFASPWVRSECQWAYTLYLREDNRTLLPVVAQPIEPSDFNAMLYLEGFARIEGPNSRPYTQGEAIERTLRMLGLVAETETPTTPAPNEESAETLLTRAQALNAQHKYMNSLPLLERAAQISPNDAQVLKSLSFTFCKLGRWYDALTASEQALVITPDDASIWANRVVILHKLGRDLEAFDACDRAIALDARSATAWTNKAGMLCLSGRYQEALAATEQAISLDPQLASSWHIRGEAMGKLDRDADALECFNRTLTLDPSFAEAWFSKANSLLKIGDTQGALSSAEQAVALDENNPRYWFAKAAALAKAMRVQDAIEALDHYFATGRIDKETYVSAVKYRQRFQQFLASQSSNANKRTDHLPHKSN